MADSYDIERLGAARIRSPLRLGKARGDALADFSPDDERVLASVSLRQLPGAPADGQPPASFELAGPREFIYFDPSKLKVGIVTCGGLCPGINDVIRGLVMSLHYSYGVAGIMGFRYGYAGLNPEFRHPIVDLTPETVLDIHRMGGTILGTSRGPQDPVVMVDTLERLNIGLFFAIGGDGTFRGAMTLQQEVAKRGLKIAVVAVPKTIDNDIVLVDHTFGFETAVALGADAIRAAYAEAASAENGIGLVKLMGRHSGFIAANAALAVRNVNLVLIPEVPFTLDGPNGLFAYIENRFAHKKSTVMVVAEGAGQDLARGAATHDASGNVRLADIGLHLKARIEERFGSQYRFTLKYIDPSYMIRSAPACASDSIYCGHLAQAAAHAGLTGRTAVAVGRAHGAFTHLPLSALVTGRKTVDPEGQLWLSVVESTGQPYRLA